VNRGKKTAYSHGRPRFVAPAATWDGAERSLLGAKCGREIRTDRPRIVEWLSQLADTVEHALRTGIEDASVRADLEIERAVTEILAAGWGLAYGWIVLPERFDLPLELQRMRAPHRPHWRLTTLNHGPERLEHIRFANRA
jgi:hypothetical protein